jgi:hypothetical protein
MALDELLLDQAVAATVPQACLRLYSWSGPWLSLGYHQRHLPAAWLADGQASRQAVQAVPDALKRFAGLRAARAARVQETGRSNGRMYHAGFPLNVARDLVLKQLGDAGMRKRYAWLYGWRLPA